MKKERIVRTGITGALQIPESFCSAMHFGPNMPVLVTLGDNEIIVRHAPAENISQGIRCLKCGYPEVIDIDIPLCSACLNRHLMDIMKENNKKK